MLEKVFYTTVLVSDQDRALDFYTNILGLELRVDRVRPVERLDDMPAASESMGLRSVTLRVVAYPWGVEFELCGGEERVR